MGNFGNNSPAPGMMGDGVNPQMDKRGPQAGIPTGPGYNMRGGFRGRGRGGPALRGRGGNCESVHHECRCTADSFYQLYHSVLVAPSRMHQKDLKQAVTATLCPRLQRLVWTMVENPTPSHLSGVLRPMHLTTRQLEPPCLRGRSLRVSIRRARAKMTGVAANTYRQNEKAGEIHPESKIPLATQTKRRKQHTPVGDPMATKVTPERTIEPSRLQPYDEALERREIRVVGPVTATAKPRAKEREVIDIAVRGMSVLAKTIDRVEAGDLREVRQEDEMTTATRIGRARADTIVRGATRTGLSLTRKKTSRRSRGVALEMRRKSRKSRMCRLCYPSLISFLDFQEQPETLEEPVAGS
jgi:hypothetical protein